ncbi:hypothetical protein Rumeso_02264 [Rubellimicrobium mesophilum DSM 19309]|uniref:Uncharacterized protein n=1 Tax=Rubellimicrobium mesophilum DSM 19309 TaxID=442562 RepID=A0A017HR06_9RHOB|nr:hypothetical protein [Rubellimicrobium mesophilum]EYD76189.1 hypothetical protein Rumeso_02264 [Rubellimicrobium mesophilum DSM 19309]
MNVLINAANLFFVLGYFTTDMLRLRLLSVVGTSCVVTYFYNQPEPMMNVVAWNCVFLVLNLVQLAHMLRSRWLRMASGWGGAVTL